MKKHIFTLYLNFSFLLCYSFAQSWYVIDPASINGTHSFNDVFFTDANTGWITTSTTANIYRTDDGGATFSTQTTPLGFTSAIHMLDENNGYSGGAGGWVYTTSDGGDNWTMLATMGSLTDISFPFNTNPEDPVGYACGDDGRVWRITATLSNLNSPSQSDFGGISAPSVNNVWVCGGNRIYYYNGTDFTSQTAPGGFFNDIHFINDQEGWVVGDGGVIGHTTDGGTSWNTQIKADSQNMSLYSVFFLDANNGWAVGNGGIILKTTNGGTTWTIEGAGLTTALLRGIHFTSATNGYVIGNGKTLIKYGLPLATEDEENISSNFTLSQNFPNPFNPSTTIEYTIPNDVILSRNDEESLTNEKSINSEIRRSAQNDKVVLIIYNILGNEVATLVDEVQEPGNYSVKFNIRTDLESVPTNGIYFYRLQVGDNIETKKMLLMK